MPKNKSQGMVRGPQNLRAPSMVLQEAGNSLRGPKIWATPGVVLQEAGNG